MWMQLCIIFKLYNALVSRKKDSSSNADYFINAGNTQANRAGGQGRLPLQALSIVLFKIWQ